MSVNLCDPGDCVSPTEASSINNDVSMNSEHSLICDSDTHLDFINSLSQSPSVSSPSPNQESIFLSSTHSLNNSMSSEPSSSYELTESLKNWALKHGCTRQCINDILRIFIDLGHSVPRDARTILNTSRNVATRPMKEGDYVYMGVQNRIEKLLKWHQYSVNKISLKINIDGIPLFKSSSLQLWPILIQFGNFKPISVAFFCGRQKPPLQDYLQDLD